MRSGTPKPSPLSLLSILGKNLHEIWIAGVGLTLSGTNVVSWKGAKQGFVLNRVAAGREPYYETDGSHFRGKPILKFSRAPALPLGFGPVIFSPPIGEEKDSVDLFMIFRTWSLTPAIENQRFPASVDGYREGLYPDRGFRFTTFTAGGGGGAGGVCGETWGWAGDGSNYYHSFPGGYADDLLPHLITGTQGSRWPPVYYDPLAEYPGSTILENGFVSKDGVSTGGDTAPAPVGRVESFRCGLVPEINRGIDMSLAVIGFTRNRLTTEQLAALTRYSRVEWGTP